jgi:acetyltransferase-like isoleucine patch superfamily enzyme
MTIVEEDCFVGPRVVFTDDPHPMGCPRYKECLGGVTVRTLARIGANCTLLPGVVVGRNSLVGAGSVVTRNVPDDMVVAGNPARIIKAVADLTCSAGFFERPYEWAPYAKGGAREKT